MTTAAAPTFQFPQSSPRPRTARAVLVERTIAAWVAGFLALSPHEQELRLLALNIESGLTNEIVAGGQP